MLRQVTALVEHLLDEQKNTRMFKTAVIFLVVFTIILLCAMTGITYAVVELAKDTEVRGELSCQSLVQLSLPAHVAMYVWPIMCPWNVQLIMLGLGIVGAVLSMHVPGNSLTGTWPWQ